MSLLRFFYEFDSITCNHIPLLLITHGFLQ